MADTITLTSTTNTESEVRNALGLPVEDAKPVVAEPTLPLEPADEDAAEEAAAAAEPAPSKHVAAGKKRGRLQSRIDELVGERDRMRGLTAAQEAELNAYRKRVADLVAMPVGVKGAEPVQPPPLETRPKVEDFATYEEYTEAVADWKVETKTAQIVERRLRDERAAQQNYQQQLSKNEMQRRYAQAEDAVKTKYDDYSETINAPDLQATDLMVDQMLRSEHGPEIAYYLGKHPEQCKKLFALGNTAEAIKQFGKVEARVEAALEAAAAPTAAGDGGVKAAASVAPSAGTRKVPAVTKAPDPITPVGAGAQGTTVDPQNMSYQDYKEWRNASERKRLGYR